MEIRSGGQVRPIARDNTRDCLITSGDEPGGLEMDIGCHGYDTFAVQQQCPLPPGVSDPFKKYPHFPAKLYSSSVSGSLEIVQPAWILSHFAHWAVSDDRVVVFFVMPSK